MTQTLNKKDAFTAMRILALPLLVLLMGLTPGKELESYEFISPKPGSGNNSPESTIILRDGAPIDQNSLTQDRIAVSGSKSGAISGNLILSPDGRTVIFKPNRPFLSGEEVEVTINPGMLTNTGEAVEGGQFVFGITPFERMPNPYEYVEEFRPNFDTGVGFGAACAFSLLWPCHFTIATATTMSMTTL